MEAGDFDSFGGLSTPPPGPQQNSKYLDSRRRDCSFHNNIVCQIIILQMSQDFMGCLDFPALVPSLRTNEAMIFILLYVILPCTHVKCYKSAVSGRTAAEDECCLKNRYTAAIRVLLCNNRFWLLFIWFGFTIILGDIQELCLDQSQTSFLAVFGGLICSIRN